MLAMIVKNWESQIRIFSIGLILAIVLFLSFSFLDYLYYPKYQFELLTIRSCISAYLLLTLFLIRHVRINRHVLIVSSAFILSALSLSLMCYITGDGFASPYCFSILQVTIVSTIVFTMKPKYYMIMIGCIVAQHFIVLSFIPWDFKSLMINVFSIGIFAIIAAVIHYFIYHKVNEINILRGIIPICSKCKKIRDDEGYWHQVESYISANSDAMFSHSLCPECIELLYPEYAAKVQATS